MRALIVVWFATWLVAGCATSGTQVNEDQLSQFVVGKTTISDVIGKLGSPNQAVVSSDGTQMVIYSYAQYQTRPETFIPFVGAFIGGGNMKTNVAILRFDRAGFFVNSTLSTGVSNTSLGAASGTRDPVKAVDQSE